MKKRRKLKLSRLIILVSIVFVFCFFVIKGFGALLNVDIFSSAKNFIPDLFKSDDYNTLLASPASKEEPSEEKEPYVPVLPEYIDNVSAGSDVESDYAILVCVDSGRVIANRNSKVKMYPASMTKIMSLVVAVEHIEDINDTFTMSYEIINPLYLQNATVTGLTSGETVPLSDLLYGAILPSGADATQALAIYTAGSEEKFVEWMNEKVEELGLVDTHFTNTSGLHDENHYTTAYDMAVILDYVMHNEICAEILGTVKHTTTSTPEHPSGIEMYSTMYSKIKRDHIDGVEIIGGKTGYTYQSGHCLVSCAEKNGRTYIAVTAKGETKYSPIYDVVALLDEYI